MIDRDGRLGRGLGHWVAWSARHAVAVAAGSIALLIPLGWYAWTHLRVDADTGNLVSNELPWRRAHAELERAFPHLLDDMQIVIDARAPEVAAEAQRRLAADLASRTDVFSFVYAPGGDEFFERHALLFSSLEELDELRARMKDYRLVWRALEGQPTLAGLADAVERLATQDSTDERVLVPVLLAMGGAFYSSRTGHYFTFPWSDLTRGRRAAPLCTMPGADPDLVESWIDAGALDN